MIVDIRATGGTIDTIIPDLGGEFTSGKFIRNLAALGVAVRYVPTDQHLPFAERHHGIFDAGMRANIQQAVPHLDWRAWPWARSCKVAQHNASVHPNRDELRSVLYNGTVSTLRTLMPYGSQIAGYSTQTMSIENNADIGTYLAPTPQAGDETIAYTIDGGKHVRHTSTFRFLALPGEHLDPETLRPLGHSNRMWPIDQPPDREGRPPAEQPEQQQETTPITTRTTTGDDSDNNQNNRGTTSGGTTRTTTAHASAPFHQAHDEHPMRHSSTRARRQTSHFTINPTTGGDSRWRDTASVLVAPEAAPHGYTTPPQQDGVPVNDHDDVPYASKACIDDPPDADIPKNLWEAAQSALVEEWAPAFQEQFDSMLNVYNTWKPALRKDVEPGTRIYRTVVGFKKKRNGKKKSRWSFDGSPIAKQRRLDGAPNIVDADTENSSSPVCSYDGVKYTFAYAASCRGTVLQMDITDFYLKFRAESRTYAHFPQGMKLWMRWRFGDDPSKWPFDPSTHLMQIDGCDWGHPDSGRISFQGLDAHLRTLGFEPLPLSRCLYYRKEKDAKPTVLALVVDDILIANEERPARRVADLIHAKWGTRGAAVASDPLGLLVRCDADGGFSLGQSDSAKRLIAKWGFAEAHPTSTPLPPGFTADPACDPSDKGGTPPRHYPMNDRLSILGGIGWLALVTRADLLHGHSTLMTAVTVWVTKHDRALTHMLRYIRGTLDTWITFPAGMLLDPEIWSDASFAMDLHHGTTYLAKSRSGTLVMMSNSFFTAASLRITASCLSTWESEISALTYSTRIAIVLRATNAVLVAAGAPICSLVNGTMAPIRSHCDNKAVIATIRRGYISGRMRHVRINISFVFDAVGHRTISIIFCPTKQMRANFLTKSEPRELFKESHSFVYGTST
jgi:hypothetical protein